MRICIIGNSHLAAVKLAWDDLANCYKDIEIVFFGARGTAMKNLEVKNGCLIPTDDFTKQEIKFTSGGQEFISFNNFDAILLYGLACDLRMLSFPLSTHRLGHKIADSRPIMSQACFTQLCEDRVSHNILFEIATMVRDATDIPIFVSPAPFPSQACIEDETQNWSYLNNHDGKITQQSYYQGISNAFSSLHAIFIPQPEATITNNVFSKPHFTKKAIRLIKGFSHIHPENDYLHMNKDYGKLLLVQFLNTINTHLLGTHYEEHLVISTPLPVDSFSEQSPFVLESTSKGINVEESGAFFTYGFSKEHFLSVPILTLLPQKTMIVKNCFVSKYEKIDSLGTRGALYEDGCIIEDETKRGMLKGSDPSTITTDRIEAAHKISSPCVYLGWLSWHFGHLLLEMPTRFWILDSIEKEKTTFLFHPLSSSPMPAEKMLSAEFVKLICDCFGISTKQIILANQDLLVEELIIPTQLLFLNSKVDRYQYSIYQQFKSYLLQSSENKFSFFKKRTQKNRKVYFSRRQLKEGKRKATNEAVIEKIFQEYGFEIVSPERLSLSEQVKLLDNVSCLAGCDGSALHLAVFLPPKTKLIVLSARNISGNQLLMSSLADIETHFICAHTNNTPVGLGGSWEADIPHLQQYLKEITFL